MKFLKWIAYFSVLVILGLGLMIFFSPYGKKEGFTEKMIIEKIIIKASAENVYNYLGDSRNASDWSTFVDHITPSNSPDFIDGEKGAIRRCFKNENEEGIFWDEKILIAEKNKRRRLNIYNLNGFSLKADNLLTEQLYTTLENGECELAFSLFYEPGKANWREKLKMYYAAYTVSSIFRGNIEQVKKNNEQ